MDMTHHFPAPALPLRTCGYSEAAYFEGEHCQHIADYEAHCRVQRVEDDARRMMGRQSARRGFPF